MPKALRILRSSDPHFWYNGLVGAYVPLVREESDVYISREPGGYANIVRKEDAIRVELSEQENFYQHIVDPT